MLLNEIALTSQQSAKTSVEARLDALAAIWARQTGRSIAVSSGGSAVRGSSRG